MKAVITVVISLVVWIVSPRLASAQNCKPVPTGEPNVDVLAWNALDAEGVDVETARMAQQLVRQQVSACAKQFRVRRSAAPMDKLTEALNAAASPLSAYVAKRAPKFYDVTYFVEDPALIETNCVMAIRGNVDVTLHECDSSLRGMPRSDVRSLMRSQL